MAYIMGDADDFVTWAGVRSPLLNNRWSDNENPPNLFVAKVDHNREFVDDGDGTDFPPTWFVDESGSMFRCQSTTSWGAAVQWRQAYEPGQPPVWLGYMGVDGLDNTDFEQYLGSLMQSPTDSVNLTADANTEDGQYVEFDPVPPNIDLYPGFTTIEGMVAIT
jgi:hypothetical protein